MAVKTLRGDKCVPQVNITAVKVNALIYEIIVAEINAIKYFNP